MKSKLIALILMAATVNSCGGSAAQSAQAQVANSETKVLIKTTAGDVTVKLYNETPLHRDNFIKLVQEHYYDSLLFHRVIRNFMVQAGDPDSRTAEKHQQLGKGGPDYTIPAEIDFPKHYHKRGVLSAARRPDQVNPDRRSSGSQFYIVTGKTYTPRELRDMEDELNGQLQQSIFDRICAQYRDTIIALQDADDQIGMMALQDEIIQLTEARAKEEKPIKFTKELQDDYSYFGGTPHLDNQYTVFGEVIDGMKVVDKIERVATDVYDRPLKDVRIITMEIIK